MPLPRGGWWAVQREAQLRGGTLKGVWEPSCALCRPWRARQQYTAQRPHLKARARPHPSSIPWARHLVRGQDGS